MIRLTLAIAMNIAGNVSSSMMGPIEWALCVLAVSILAFWRQIGVFIDSEPLSRPEQVIRPRDIQMSHRTTGRMERALVPAE